MNVLGIVVAPATLVSALLFYFGYVSSRAQFDYFGVDVDTIGLGTKDYVMRSPQPLLVPVLALALLGAALLAVHTRLRRRAGEPAFRGRMRRSIGLGLVLAGIAVVLLFCYPLLSRWAYYPLVTPLLLAVGGALIAYGLGSLRFLAHQRPAGDQEATPPPRLGLILLVWAATGACLFWATATIAQWSGLGLAKSQAQHLGDLPSVVVDTKEPLYLPAQSQVHELALPGPADRTYRYRYWGLRLLIVGNHRMFLVPDVWDAHDTTLVMPMDDSTRVQFQFRNLAP